MADGSSGNLGGVLFEAGKTISDAGKGAANAAASQITGNPTPLFTPNGQKPQTTGLGGFLPQKPAGTGTTNPLDNFGKMFETNKPGFGPKKPMSPAPQSQQFSQEELDTMAAQNKASDDQEILKRQAELEQIKQSKHKQLHDEVYYEAIKNVGQHTMAQERKEKEEAKQQEEAQKQQNPQQNQLGELGSNMMGKNQQLGTPVAVTQAKTQTEANRGTTG